MLRLTSPQAASVESSDSLIFFTKAPRPDLWTPWNWMLLARREPQGVVAVVRREAVET